MLPGASGSKRGHEQQYLAAQTSRYLAQSLLDVAMLHLRLLVLPLPPPACWRMRELVCLKQGSDSCCQPCHVSTSLTGEAQAADGTIHC